MTEIPEDIMKTAEAIVKPALASIQDHPFSTSTCLVARAILAERERCAKIVDGYVGTGQIVAAIRKREA